EAPAIDLILFVHPRELDRAGLTSLYAASIKAAATPGLLDTIRADLAKLRAGHPKDIAVAVATTLAALATGKLDEFDAELARLVQLAEETPLEPLPPGARANARQRADAAKQLGLWLVARECASRDAHRATGEILADRAIEAARRQADPLWPL